MFLTLEFCRICCYCTDFSAYRVGTNLKLLISIKSAHDFIFDFFFFQTDLFGQDLLNFVHPDDRNYLKQQIVPKNLEKLFEVAVNERGEPAERTEEEEREIDRKLKEDKRTFTVR